jgi:hypothetical protein
MQTTSYYQIGLTLTVFMSTARTVEPYVVGKDMTEEIEVDFHVPLVQQGSLSTGYTSKQPTNEHLKQIMEHKIMHMVDDYKESTTADAKNTNEVYCTHCDKNPCVWGTNKEAMLQFNKSEHDLLTGTDIPAPSLCRKKDLSADGFEDRRGANWEGCPHGTSHLRRQRHS